MSERKSPLSKKQLDPASFKRLEAILGKEPAALTDAEVAFLWGRRDYLTAEERKDYGVNGKKSPVGAQRPEAPTQDEPDTPEDTDEDNDVDDEEEDEDEQDEYDVMDKEALKAACKERGLKVSGTNEELRERLRA
jgi:hypothetical protein